MANSTNQIQHQPVRVPQGWQGQNVTMIMQVNQLFDDVYRHLAVIEKKLKEIEEALPDDES